MISISLCSSWEPEGFRGLGSRALSAEAALTHGHGPAGHASRSFQLLGGPPSSPEDGSVVTVTSVLREERRWWRVMETNGHRM